MLMNIIYSYISIIISQINENRKSLFFISFGQFNKDNDDRVICKVFNTNSEVYNRDERKKCVSNQEKK